MIFNGGRSAAVGETEHADKFSRGAGQPDQGAIAPTQAGGESSSQDLVRTGEGNVARIFRQSRTERVREATYDRLVLDFRCNGFRCAGNHDGLLLRRLKKAEGNGACSQQFGGSKREVACELG